MQLSMIATYHLKPAAQKPGCLICRIRHQFESRYIDNVMLETVNDPGTRSHLINSLGYCPKHTWQMGLLEVEKLGDALGNAIIFEDLVASLIDPLLQYREGLANHADHPRSTLGGWIQDLLPKSSLRQPDPFSSMVMSTCRVCQIGQRAQDKCLTWMLEGLSEPEPAFREDYRASDGVCLTHFRQAITLRSDRVETGIGFLLDQMLESLPDLKRALSGYIVKHASDHRGEKMSAEEKNAWIKAARLIAGNEANLLIDDLPVVQDDDRFTSKG